MKLIEENTALANMSQKTDKMDQKEEDSGRVGRLEEHTMGYYRRVSDKIQEGFENEEEKDMFVSNVYAELKGNEIRVSQNQTVSRILETILPLSSWQQLSSFLQGMTSDLSTASTDRFASHVLQSVMSEALKHVAGKGTGRELSGIYEQVCEEMVGNIQEVMMDTYASHVLRTLISCLAGIRVADNVSRSKLSRGQQQKEMASETRIILTHPPEAFLTGLENILRAITKTDNLSEYITSTTAGPVLEVLLLSLHHANQGKCRKLTRSLLNQANLLSKEKPDESEDSPLPSLMTHPISSHLLEVILKAVEDDLLLKVIDRSFKGQLTKLAIHGSANFVLQRLLERVKQLPVFEELFDELMPNLESILAVNHLGVIQRLAAGCVSHTSKQVPFLQSLMKAFHCDEPRDRQSKCVPLFAAMVTYEVMFGEKDADKDPSDDPSSEAPAQPPCVLLQGSLLLQEMLKFSKNGTILNSFLSMPPPTLVSMATQPSGSRLLEAFMKSNVIGEKKKDQFVENIKGSCFQIACNKNGSRTIEGIFGVASIKSKFAIAETLAERESHLLSHPFGRFVHRNLSLGHFRTRRAEWKAIQMKQAQKRKLFADIVGAPTKKDKPAEDKKTDDVLAEEVAKLTGSKRVVDEEDAEEEGDNANDEIAAIFSGLPQKRSSDLATEITSEEGQASKKKKKKKKKALNE